MRISDWSSDVCSSDLLEFGGMGRGVAQKGDAPPPDRDQMRARRLASNDIVGHDRQSDNVLGQRPPAHEFRVHLDQMLKLGAIEMIIAIAEPDADDSAGADLLVAGPDVGPLL